MRGENDAGTLPDRILDGRHRTANTCVVRDLAVLDRGIIAVQTAAAAVIAATAIAPAAAAPSASGALDLDVRGGIVIAQVVCALVIVFTISRAAAVSFILTETNAKASRDDDR